MPHSDFSPRARAREQLNACIRTLYENTRVPVREIARLAGVTDRNIYALVRRLGCQPRGRAFVGERGRAVGAEQPSTACRRAAKWHRKLAADARADVIRRVAQRRAWRKHQASARAFMQLAKAVRELARLDARPKHSKPRRRRAREADDENLDARRRELARCIANLSDDTSVSGAPREAANTGKSPSRKTPSIRLLSN